MENVKLKMTLKSETPTKYIKGFIFLMMVLSIFINTVFSRGGIEDNKAIARFIGIYTLMYAWPIPDFGNTRVSYPDCALVKYKRFRYNHKDPLTCECHRNNTNLALVQQLSNYAGWPLLVDIINYPDDVEPALNDNCICSPSIALGFAVIRELPSSCFVLHERTEGRNSSYLLCRRVLKDPELFSVKRDITEGLAGNGMRMCNEKHWVAMKKKNMHY